MNAQFDATMATKEILDRARRTETRVTRIANHLGLESGAERARFDNGQIVVGSRKIALDDLMALVPPEMKGEIVDICCNGEVLATLTVER